jgi:hypothetical protein
MPRRKPTLDLVLATLLIGTSIPAVARGEGKPGFQLWPTRKPETVDSSVAHLARCIDRLEQRIDKVGSIVVKQPDIWGQARLARYRREFEQEMEKEREGFRDTIQGSVSRREQSYLSAAMALDASLANPILEESDKPPKAPPATPALPGAAPPLKTDGLGRITATGSRSNQEIKGISIEPTVYLDQKARYLNHLHELRRINDGDDTADFPGYALHLVRIPVSVLPGSQTRKGYGAEVTITATPFLHPELLPTTMRRLVINGLVDQFAVPMWQTLDLFAQNALERPYFEAMRLIYQKTQLQDAPADRVSPAARDRKVLWINHELRRLERLRSRMSNCEDCEPDPITALAGVRPRPLQLISVEQPPKAGGQPDTALRGSMEQLDFRAMHEQLQCALSNYRLQASHAQRSRLGLPVSQFGKVYGYEVLFLIGAEAYDRLLALRSQGGRAFGPNVDGAGRDVIAFEDVLNFLRAEIEAAYDLLDTPEFQVLWTFCGPELAQAIRSRDQRKIDHLRERFLAPLTWREEGIKHDITAVLAWAVMVEATLLNDWLMQDVRITAHSHNRFCPEDAWIDFVNPRPTPEARVVFNDHVRARWPAHMFAIDPVVQDQNLGDKTERSRELQLALAVAFSRGLISGHSLTRMMRRMEEEAETISLNRTAAGFVHGADTFGWRFSPRYQTPPVEGSVLTGVRDLVLGGPVRDHQRKHRELEAGPRECVALVVMPSFVPTCTFDIRANWFRLDDPKRTIASIEETMQLSREVTRLKNVGLACSDARCYREGEINRLQRRVDQLADELPLQTLLARTPYELDLSGFELFTRSRIDLGPEITNHAGLPGINPNGPTTLYLVGDHFSLHETKVIAGGLPVAEAEVLSRQVIRLTIPSGAQTIERGTAVDVQVATPYGVSPHHRIPIAPPNSARIPTELRPMPDPSGSAAPRPEVSAPRSPALFNPSPLPGGSRSAPADSSISPMGDRKPEGAPAASGASKSAPGKATEGLKSESSRRPADGRGEGWLPSTPQDDEPPDPSRQLGDLMPIRPSSPGMGSKPANAGPKLPVGESSRRATPPASGPLPKENSAKPTRIDPSIERTGASDDILTPLARRINDR